jgi:hypothetical protein
MSIASPPVPIDVNRATRWRPPAEVGPLARLEARQLLLHPMFLISVALSSLYYIRAGEGMAHTYVGSNPWGFFPLAAGTLIAANLAATRTCRDGTEELYESLACPRSLRTAGQLAGLLCTLPVSAVLIAAGYLSDALVISNSDRFAVHAPTMIELAYGPLMVIAFGALGILLARLAPSPIIGPLLIVAIFQAQPADGGGWGAWLLPLWNDMPPVRPEAPGPCEHGHAVPGCGQTLHHLPGTGWHLSYLVGLTLLAAAAALVRGRRPLPFAGLAVLAAALAVTTKFASG